MYFNITPEQLLENCREYLISDAAKQIKDDPDDTELADEQKEIAQNAKNIGDIISGLDSLAWDIPSAISFIVEMATGKPLTDGEITQIPMHWST